MPNWKDVLGEINQLQSQGQATSQGSVDFIRHKYLHALYKHTKRNVIAYYSGFLSKPTIQSDIADEDKNGFMMAIHALDRSCGLDLILHTPGGGIAATQSIVDYLHKMFGRDIRAIVPQIAMSAGTMVACSCSRILMSNHSNLGPIDPQLNGVPAYGVLKEFRQACSEVSKDASKIPIWQAIISQYPPTFLGQCKNAISWSNSFVQQQLEDVMFHGMPDAAVRARAIVRKLSSFSQNKSHDRHIHTEECEQMGLTVERLEADADLQDLVLTVHHCYMHTLTNTNAHKIIENHLGDAFIKHQQQVVTVPASG